jgi:hypothetical protein
MQKMWRSKNNVVIKMNLKIQDLGFWNIAFYHPETKSIYINKNYIYNKKVLKLILKHEFKHMINHLTGINTTKNDWKIEGEDSSLKNEVYSYFPFKVRLKIMAFKLFTIGFSDFFIKHDDCWYISTMFGESKIGG